MLRRGEDSPKILVMFLGYPGAGKTYFAVRLAQKVGAVRVNGDALRVAMYGSIERTPQEAHGPGSVIFKAIDYFASQILMSGKSIIYDAHHNRRVTRSKLEKMAATYGAVPLVVWVKTPADLSKARAIGRDITPDQDKLTEEKYQAIFERQSTAFDSPLPSEKVIEIDGTAPFEVQYADFQTRLEQLLA